MLGPPVVIQGDLKLLTFLREELLWNFNENNGQWIITLLDEEQSSYDAVIHNTQDHQWEVISDTFVEGSYYTLAGCFHGILTGELKYKCEAGPQEVLNLFHHGLDQYLFSKLDYYGVDVSNHLKVYFPGVLASLITEYLVPDDFELFSQEMFLSYQMVDGTFYLVAWWRQDLLWLLDFGGTPRISSLPPGPEGAIQAAPFLKDWCAVCKTWR